MKKVTFILMLLFLSVGIKAQTGFYYGGMLGIGQSSFKPSSLGSQTNMLMAGGGVAASYHFSDFVGVTVNGLVVSKGTKATGTAPGGIVSNPEDYEETYSLLYAEIPMMLKLRYGKNNFYGKIFGGPSFNFNLDGRYGIDYKNSTNKDISGQRINNLQVMETALVYGAGVEVQTGSAGLYSLEFRMSNGLSSIGKTTRNSNDIFSQYFSICLGWSMK